MHVLLDLAHDKNLTFKLHNITEEVWKQALATEELGAMLSSILTMICYFSTCQMDPKFKKLRRNIK